MIYGSEGGGVGVGRKKLNPGVVTREAEDGPA